MKSRVKSILQRELSKLLVETSAGDTWFKSLSPKQQKEYIKKRCKAFKSPCEKFWC